MSEDHGRDAAPAIILLAGGEGRRIGGAKPLRSLGGRTLLAHSLDRSRFWSDMRAISVRRTGDLPSDLPIVTDDPDVAGPLAGIAAGLRFAASIGRRMALTLPCDTPFVPRDLPQRLSAAIGDRMAAVAASAGRLHPACALWRIEAAEQLDLYLATGRRSVHGFLEFLGYEEAVWSAEPIDPFFNINDAADLAKAEFWLGTRQAPDSP
jgi:molybdopterin-guanine dinucleotide biosynthesis protein A